jgi:hydroxymethylbilane synthase
LKKIVLATRKSPLARAQTDLVAAHLRARLGAEIELLPIVTTGDRQTEWSLEKKGGKGLFTSELEQALAGGQADLAIHSAKDLPGEAPPGLVVAGYLPRADPHDVLVIRAGVAAPATLATGSPRRRLQAARLFPTVAFGEIRGNVDTRLRKIAEPGLADGTLLAAAGLNRLGITSWPGLEFRPLDFSQMVPAVGQGAIAVQSRADEGTRWGEILDRATARAVGLERAFQAALGAGCQTAFAAHAAADSLYFYHEQTGGHRFPLTDADYGDPAATALRLLKSLGLSR